MSKVGKTGVNSNTPKNIMFGAGTIHKNLKYAATGSGAEKGWNFDSSIIGATQGGSKLSIKPEFKRVEADGALVAVKGLEVKIGEKATMEVNFLEITKDIIKAASLGTDGTSTDAEYDLIESKGDIGEGDYFENIAFVGLTLDGRKIIAILDNALCTSGLETEGKNKDNAVGKYTFECFASDTSDLSKLPWHIYYPKTVA